MQIAVHANETFYPQAHIMVISDDRRIARIWGMALENFGLKVSLADLDEQALKIRAEVMPDMVVVDSHAQHGEDIKFCRQLHQESIVPLLLFTTQHDEQNLLDAYLAGVDEVIPQPISLRLIIAKLRAWLRHIQSTPSAVMDELQVGEFHLNEAHRQLLIPGRCAIQLTYLEARLLYVLMSHPDQVQETESLVERVWGHYGQGESVLVKNLIYRLRRKIEPDPAHPRYLMTVDTRGYYFTGDQASTQSQIRLKQYAETAQ